MNETGKRTIKTIRNASAIEKAEKKEILRTAAYCRVSTLQEEQELSFDNQCEYYRTLIDKDEKKVLVGIYGDHGISGLRADQRPELQRMLQDCRDGKIDSIMTRSISRLARNAAECQEIIMELKALGIPVHFEKEEIISTDPQFELILKLLSATAQEESNSISQAIRWSHNNNNKLGNPTRSCAYGYRKQKREKRTDKHIWEIYEPEAKHVRQLFQWVLDGKSYADMRREINQIEILEGTSRTWTHQTIMKMLTNEVYIGDILTNKSVCIDYVSGKVVKNHGEFEQYYLEDHHPAIIKRKTFDKVQEIVESRKGNFKGGRKAHVR